MTNFDFLKNDSRFKTFSNVAVAAEQIIHIDKSACVLNCRRAMEFAVKWMYSVDDSLIMPYQDNLVSLINTDEFKGIVDKDLWKRMDFIRRAGNNAAHVGKETSFDEASLCLQNLFIFLDFIAYCYSGEYEEHQFNEELLKSEKTGTTPNINSIKYEYVDFKKLIDENKALKDELTERRKTQQPAYTPKPLDMTEFETRKIYIDTMLRDAGWEEGKNWVNEAEVLGMPNKSGKGYVDYVLYDDTQKPLAIVEAKRSCEDVSKGRQQAKLYADILEKQYKRRPVIFLTNGFDTRIIDNQYPERKVAAVYSKRDLEKWFNLLFMRTSLRNINVDKKIVDRYYQEEAIKAVCAAFDEKNKRKALLVMATGSGKTRTIIALCKVLLNAGWIKNILFLADRNSLVTQAKRSFVNLMGGNLSVSNVVEEKDDFNARCIFSTYQTMYGLIDEAKDEQGIIFSIGHFDLVICDEAHRSIYNKYKEIFNYFDAPLVGLTATPKDEIDRNTYRIFELEYDDVAKRGLPTYAYDLKQAVNDGYLVDYLSVESKFKFLENGIVYDELSKEDKEAFEQTFENESGELPENIKASEINKWVFNEDTIKKVLQILMTQGLKIGYGEKLGKTIIFAKNHKHAEKILEIFNKEYPYLSKNGHDFATVIDNYTTYTQSAIDNFSNPSKLPQIAISVDMLDTGIDIPEILNLVFFKKVMSKAKFWQMIGRGTRLCRGLLDGEDKDKFYIFDFCGNFEFFRLEEDKPTANMVALQSAIFNYEFQIAYKLQGLNYQDERLIAYRNRLVKKMSCKVSELKKNFAVKQHLKYIDKYSHVDGYDILSYEDTLIVREEVAPFILPDNEDINAVRFDALMYGIELAYLAQKKYTRARGDLMKKITAIACIANIPEIQMKSDLIKKVLHTNYVECAGIDDFEYIREELRGLMKYIAQGEHAIYDTDFSDDLLSTEWHEAELENKDLENYRIKAEHYVRQNQDNIVIAKLKANKPLTEFDVASLEKILWSDIGSKADYQREYGNKPLGEFVRGIVGLDMNAAKEAFSEYLNEVNMNNRQIYFVNQIVEYIVHNGILKDLSVLQESPFTDKGSVVEIFSDDLNIWLGIKKTIDNINSNAVA